MALAVLSVAAFPCWRYSASWGYGPTFSAGILLVVVALATAGAKANGGHALSKLSPARVSAEEGRLVTLLGTEVASMLRQ